MYHLNIIQAYYYCIMNFIHYSYINFSFDFFINILLFLFYYFLIFHKTRERLRKGETTAFELLNASLKKKKEIQKSTNSFVPHPNEQKYEQQLLEKATNIDKQKDFTKGKLFLYYIIYLFIYSYLLSLFILIIIFILIFKNKKKKQKAMSGIPVCLKDNLCSKGDLTSAASKILSSKNKNSFIFHH